MTKRQREPRDNIVKKLFLAGIRDIDKRRRTRSDTGNLQQGNASLFSHVRGGGGGGTWKIVLVKRKLRAGETGVGKILWKLDYLHGVSPLESLGEEYNAWLQRITMHASERTNFPCNLRNTTQRDIFVISSRDETFLLFDSPPPSFRFEDRGIRLISRGSTTSHARRCLLRVGNYRVTRLNFHREGSK